MLRLDLDAASVLSLDDFQDGLNDLIRHVHHMGSALGGADRIHVADLGEAVVADADTDLPPIGEIVENQRRGSGILSLTNSRDLGALQVELHITFVIGDRQLLAVQRHPDLLVGRTGDVMSALHHEACNVIVQLLHAKLCKIRPEGDLGVVGAGEIDDLRLVLFGHVVLIRLRELLFHALVCSLDDEFRGEDVGEFGTIAVPAACHLLLLVVVVVAGEEVSEDEFRNVAIVLLMHDNGHALPVVHDGDEALLLVDDDVDGVHAFRVPVRVVGSIHQDLVKDFVQCRDEVDLFEDDLTLAIVVNEHVLMLMFSGADIRVRPQ
mmetsp:Transcript_34625/g.112674  ORF Transcript_34625/g.112674 Transcript_34625/m.112674 type:complete len:321 (-) Transcript_34625:198-1160(-)